METFFNENLVKVYCDQEITVAGWAENVWLINLSDKILLLSFNYVGLIVFLGWSNKYIWNDLFCKKKTHIWTIIDFTYLSSYFRLEIDADGDVINIFSYFVFWIIHLIFSGIFGFSGIYYILMQLETLE